jgi:dolichol kinase
MTPTFLMNENKNIFFRKGIHLISGYIFIWISSYEGTAIHILGSMAFLTLLIDLSRLRINKLNTLILSTFGPLFKPVERHEQLTGASTLWMGLYFIYLIFPAEIFTPAAWIMIISDGMAAVLGCIVPIHKFQNDKSIGGTTTFFICTLLILQYANIPLIPSLLMAIILSTIEFFWKGSLENIVIGLTGSILLFVF